MNVELGKYPQGARGKILPIEWIVLDKQNDKQLLISKYALENKPFHNKKTYATWAKSSIRKWLNNEFLNISFTNEELQLIIDTKHQVTTNKQFDDDQGPATIDKIFLLDYVEANKYFEYEVDRICKPTPYLSKLKHKNGACYWRLSTVSEYSGYSVNGFVTDDGLIIFSGAFDPHPFFTWVNVSHELWPAHLIRPAMWIKNN